MKSNNPVTVYWSPYSRVDRLSYVNLLSSPPQKFLSTLGNPVVDKPASYHNCRGVHNLMKNTYVISAPLSSTAYLSGDTNDSSIETNTPVWNKRASSVENSYAIDYDFSWIFFSEETVILRQTHPYMHRTSFLSSGYLTSGSFDISKWFRPINITFNLWKSENIISVIEGEPLCYVEFFTLDERPVVLKQFEVTESLYDYCSQALIMSKNVIPFQRLEDLYKRFTTSGRNKKILKEIQQNIL